LIDGDDWFLAAQSYNIQKKLAIVLMLNLQIYEFRTTNFAIHCNWLIVALDVSCCFDGECGLIALQLNEKRRSLVILIALFF